MDKAGCIRVIITGLALLLLAAPAGWAGGGLAGRLQSLGPGEEARVIVRLADQVDPDAVTSGVKGRDKGLRTRLLVQALKERRDKTQKELLKSLGLWGRSGLVRDVNDLWIANAVSLTAPREVLDEIAAMPEVLDVYPVEKIYLEVPVTAAAAAEDNITLINAPALWDLGYTGQGVVVATIDSGVDGQHPDLAGAYRGGANSWYDPNGEHAAPYDADGHGTGVMGVMVGGGYSGTAIGVAPGAKWIAVKVFNDNGDAYTDRMLLGFQWLLDPDGNPATDDGPDVVNNSWGVDVAGLCDDTFAQNIDVLRAAGIVTVFAAGNYGPSPGSDVSPANNAGAVSVGATDLYDNVQLFSSRGLSSCTGGIFPSLCAPGAWIRTAGLSHGGLPVYTTVSGTSFSAPHVSGAVALLLSASPGLTVGQLETALVDGALDLPPAGPDNTSGNGRLDVLASYNAIPAPQPAETLTLVSPDSGAGIWRGAFPTFSWQAAGCSGFEVQFARTPDFSVTRVFAPDDGGLTEYTPNRRAWRRIKRLGSRGRTVYWRAKGIAESGAEIYSDTRTFTILRYPPAQ